MRKAYIPRALFIVLEGPDKSGKSTQAKLLSRHLRRRRIPFMRTREPGGTAFAEAIRKILLSPRHPIDPMAELLLYEAARAQHTSEKILPALRDGKIVLCERYTMATLAYQGYGRGFPLGLVRRLNQIAAKGLKPDLTVLLDIPDSEFSSRRRGRRDRLEREPSRFRRRVREGYRRLARGRRDVAVLNGRLGVRAIHRAVLRRVEGLIR